MFNLSFSYNTTPLAKIPTLNDHIGIDRLIEIIRDPEGTTKNKGIRDVFSKTIQSTLDSGKDLKTAQKEAKKAIAGLKKGLPAFQLSGWQMAGHGKEYELHYNGCIQLDIDMKYPGGDRDAVELKTDLFNSTPWIVFAALSPTFGVKCLFATDNVNKANHEAIGKALAELLTDVLKEDYPQVSVDYCEPHKLCFVPYDPEVECIGHWEQYPTSELVKQWEQKEAARIEAERINAEQAASNTPRQSINQYDRVKLLANLSESTGIDITGSYQDWLNIGFALANEFGETGRTLFHQFSKLHSSYSFNESDRQYNACMKSGNYGDLGALFNIASDYGLRLK